MHDTCDIVRVLKQLERIHDSDVRPCVRGERTDLCRRPEALEPLVHEVCRSSWEVILDLGPD